MKILICLSNVPDTTTKIKFTGDNTQFDAAGVQWIINPWDELALTRALEIKETSGTTIEKVTVLTVGKADTEPTLRKALAIGADDAVRIDAEPKDAYQVAAQITGFVKEQPYDIILCGIESSDYNGSTVGGMLAEFLDSPSVSSVSGLFLENGQIRLNREIDGGQEVLETMIPFVAIVQKGIAKEPRIPSMRGIMMARSKPLTVKPAVAADELTGFTAFELPPPHAKCKMIDAENVGELVKVFRNELKII
ncbi:MAG: electron transfer flavoprotein subunit beta/FixA family protein [Bacteroidales bacterium]|nr:electron transfer flavoprotein subunit beta/FixA family protein [Bacteroidales bacterium]